MSNLTDRARALVQQSEAVERQSFDLMTERRPFVRVAELAAYLDTERRTIIRMIDLKKLHAVRVGREWRVDTDSARAAFPRSRAS